MVKKTLIKGSHAIAEAAIRAGCECYFGYPITPQSEIGEYLSAKLPELEKVFIPAESETSAVNMLLGAGMTGVKAMTSSSSCGIALKQETISYMAAGEVPGVIINISRGGPGLGNISPSQGDYFQTVKGGGNGDYRVVVLAPCSVQEMIDFTYRAFHLSQKYRTPVFILGDALIAQMMEPVSFSKYPYPEISTEDWALSGAKDRESRFIGSLDMKEENLESKIKRLFEKYRLIAQNETSYEDYCTENADIVITAFGSVARIAKEAVKKARENGIKVGLLRPITLFPFPEEKISSIADSSKLILDIEMNMGQMLQDVKLAVNGKTPVEFYGRAGGKIPGDEQIYQEISRLAQELELRSS